MAAGYEHNFVKGDPPEEYVCLICTNVARNPYQVGCCGKLFCKYCLNKHIETHRSDRPACPHCRHDKKLVYFKDARGQRSILNLEVYCDNQSNGCTWEGTIREIKGHECSFEKIECDNECGETLVRSQLSNHLRNDCPLRSYTCSHCGIEGVYEIISSEAHLNDCPNVTITCPNEECEESFMRKDMVDHFCVCPKKVIQCPYMSVGCNGSFKREELEEHKRNSIQEHLDLAIGTLIKVKEDQKKHVVVAVKEFNIIGASMKYTPEFYISPCGYKMYLGLRCIGGTHLMLLVLMSKGDYDDTLEWPCKEVVNVTLLNQLSDTHHHTASVTIERKTVMCREYGVCRNFILLSNLAGENYTYLKDDTLYFRVSLATPPHEQTKEWLITTESD